MTLGEELREINRKKQSKANKELRARQERELREAKEEAKLEFDDLVKDLPDKIRRLNNKGTKYITILEATYRNGRYDFDLKERQLSYLIKNWALENGLKVERRPWERLDDWEEHESLSIYWE